MTSATDRTTHRLDARQDVLGARTQTPGLQGSGCFSPNRNVRVHDSPGSIGGMHYGRLPRFTHDPRRRQGQNVEERPFLLHAEAGSVPAVRG